MLVWALLRLATAQSSVEEEPANVEPAPPSSDGLSPCKEAFIDLLVNEDYMHTNYTSNYYCYLRVLNKLSTCCDVVDFDNGKLEGCVDCSVDCDFQFHREWCEKQESYNACTLDRQPWPKNTNSTQNANATAEATAEGEGAGGEGDDTESTTEDASGEGEGSGRRRRLQYNVRRRLQDSDEASDGDVDESSGDDSGASEDADGEAGPIFNVVQTICIPKECHTDEDRSNALFMLMERGPDAYSGPDSYDLRVGWRKNMVDPDSSNAGLKCPSNATENYLIILSILCLLFGTVVSAWIYCCRVPTYLRRIAPEAEDVPHPTSAADFRSRFLTDIG